MIKLKDNTGIGYQQALDNCLTDLQDMYHISRRDARRLFAETIIRNCVWEEFISTADYLIGKEKDYDTI